MNLIAEDRAVLEEKLNHCNLLIKNRDSEIGRLQAKLDMGTINVDKMSSDFELEQQVEKADRLNHQLDFLTKENTRLE